MKKKDKKTNEKEQDILYLRGRLIFQEIKFRSIFGFLLCYPCVILIILLIVDLNLGAGTFDKNYREISIVIGKVIIALLLLGAIIDNLKHNYLIKKGKVIIADIDKNPFALNPLLLFFAYEKIECSYHDYEQGKVWEFKGSYTEFCPAQRNYPDTSALRQEWHIPVLVDEKNYKRYFVLTRELVHSYDCNKWKRFPYFTRVKRKIDLTQIENGTKFSTSVKFR